MSGGETSEPGSFTDKAEWHEQPRLLNNDELVVLRFLIEDFKYRRHRRAEWKRNWPVISLVITIAISAGTSIVTFLFNHISIGGPKP